MTGKESKLGRIIGPDVSGPAKSALGVVKIISVKSSKGQEIKQPVVNKSVKEQEPPSGSLRMPRMPKKTPEIRSGIAVIGRFTPWPWGQHPDEAYLADAIESLGIPTYRVEPPGEIAMEAEWALFTGHPDSREQMEYWKHTHKTILWTLDWLPDYAERRVVIEAGRKATIFATADKYDWKHRFNVRNHIYLPGACERIAVTFDPRPRRPCAFMGALYSKRRRAIEKIIRKHKGAVLAEPQTWIYGAKLAAYVQETKVIVGDNARNDVNGYWSTRNYVIPGAGGFLLTADVPGLDRDFGIGEHISVYQNLAELDEGLGLCIAYDEEREHVRHLGFEHVQKFHSWDERAKQLARKIGLLKEIRR